VFTPQLPHRDPISCRSDVVRGDQPPPPKADEVDKSFISLKEVPHKLKRFKAQNRNS